MFARVRAKEGSAVDYIVVALGNPGKQYENTRHNTGFIAVDRIAEKFGFDIKRLKFKSLVGDTEVDGKRVLFLKPSTFMNLSGEAVREAMNFYKLSIDKLLVICDDVTLDVGKLRIRTKGSAGGHNGLKSIIYCMNSDEFNRIKIGVGQKPHPDYDLADWVLGKLTKAEVDTIKEQGDSCADIVKLFVNNKLPEAMNKYSR